MDPSIPPGKYTISITTENGTYHIGRTTDNPDTIGILPEIVEPLPIFTVENAGEVDEYTISIDGQSVNKKGDGKLCLGDSEAGERWKFVPLGDGLYIIKGDSGCLSIKSFDLASPVNLSAIPVRTCAGCPQDCQCWGVKQCVHCTTCPCKSPPSDDPRVPTGGCSGCPSPCMPIRLIPAPE